MHISSLRSKLVAVLCQKSSNAVDQSADFAALMPKIEPDCKPPKPVTFNDQDYAEFQKAFGSTFGSANFTKRFDFNNDNTIDGTDMAEFGNHYKPSKPVTFNDQDYAEFQNAFGSTLGAANFVKRFDFNNDNTIDGTDMAEFGNHYVPSPPPEPPAGSFEAAFGSTKGGAKYDWKWDYNRDGTIDGTDFCEYGNRNGKPLEIDVNPSVKVEKIQVQVSAASHKSDKSLHAQRYCGAQNMGGILLTSKFLISKMYNFIPTANLLSVL